MGYKYDIPRDAHLSTGRTSDEQDTLFLGRVRRESPSISKQRQETVHK